MGRLRDGYKDGKGKGPASTVPPVQPVQAPVPIASKLPAVSPEGPRPLPAAGGPATGGSARPSAPKEVPAPAPAPAAKPSPPAHPAQEKAPETPKARIPNVAPEEGTLAYQRDVLERQAFERKSHIILSGTVQRIRLGQVLSSEAVAGTSVSQTEAPGCTDDIHMGGYVWGLGQKPKGVAGGLKLVGGKKESHKEEESPAFDDRFIWDQLVPAAKELKRHSVPLEEGPYADKNGIVAELADMLLKNVATEAKKHMPASKDGPMLMTFEHIIDLRPDMGDGSPRAFPSLFDYDEGFLTPDRLPSAGEILSQRRQETNSVTGAPQTHFVHPMEQYILAVSILRRRGFDAYPAQAVMPFQNGELAHPLIVVVDMAKGNLLTTLDMSREHPRMGAVDILSDVAVIGAMHAMLAEARVRHLNTLIVQLSMEGKSLDMGSLQNQLERIARSLSISAEYWDGNPFIPRCRDYLFQSSVEALLAVDPNMALPDMSAEPIRSGEGIRLPTFAEVTAANYTGYMTGNLARLIAKAGKEEPKE